MSAFGYAVVVAIANVAGGWLVVAGSRLRDVPLRFLVAFGGGFMLAVALLEMLPGALEAPGGTAWVLVGYLGVHLTQHMLTSHFHFGEETHHELMVSKSIGYSAFVGLLPHSFFDGVAIASGLLADPELGFFIFLAVLLHKIPAGVSLASIMLASGNSRSATLAAVAGVGLSTLVGALVTPEVAPLARYGLGLAAGVTIYVAASNLIPEAQRERGWLVAAGLFLGVAAFWATSLLLPHGGSH